MEKYIAVIKKNSLYERMVKSAHRLERLSAEAFFDTVTAVMYRLILFLGVPYFFFVLWSFIRMQG